MSTVVDLPYASLDAAELTFKDLNRARHLISKEMHARRQDELNKISTDAREAQAAIAEEKDTFRDALYAALESGSGDEGVVLSPLSGRRHHHHHRDTGSGRRDASGETSNGITHGDISSSNGNTDMPQFLSSKVGLLFPRVVLPNPDREPRVSRKRARSEVAEDTDEDQKPLFPGASQKPLAVSSSSTPPPISAAQASEAVYYEALLGQSIGARLFLAHNGNALVKEGETFLAGLQQTQDVLLAANRRADDVNALRFLEQREFAKAYTDLRTQAARTRQKVFALEKSLGLATGAVGETTTSSITKRSVLATLATDS